MSLCLVPTFWKSVKYGGKSDPVSLLTVEVSTTPKEQYMMENKTVIFLVDVSGSMENALPSVKASLLAYRDTVIGEGFPDDDMLFRGRSHTEIITFSDKIKEVWSSRTSVTTFNDAVASLKSGGRTNMGDGLRAAFAKCSPNNISWIVVLTDGDSNVGECQSLDSFRRLIFDKPKYTKIITLGYGINFKPEILTCIGSFTYLEDIETITYLMGSLYFEISTCKFFEVRIGVLFASLRIVIGSYNVGTMSNDRKFVLGAIMPPGTIPGPPFDSVQTHFAVLTPEGIKEEIRTDKAILSLEENLPVHINQAYYTSKTAKYIEKLYKDATTNRDARVPNKIKASVEKWTDEALPYKENVLRIIEKLGKSQGSERAAAIRMAISGGKAAQAQTSYIDRSYMSPASISAAQHTQNISSQYH